MGNRSWVVALIALTFVAFLVFERERQPAGAAHSGQVPADSVDVGTPELVLPGAAQQRAPMPAGPESPASWRLVTVDPAGTPIAGVELRGAGGAERGVEPSDERGELSVPATELQQLAQAGGELHHPDYMVGVLSPEQVGVVERVVLRTTWNLIVDVSDAVEAPIFGAVCGAFDSAGNALVTRLSDAGGTATLERIRANPIELTVTAANHAPFQTRVVAGESGEEFLLVELTRGRRLEVRVMDPLGQSVAGARVGLHETSVLLDDSTLAWSESTDEQGLAVLEGFPEAGRFQVEASAAGYSGVTLPVDAQELDGALELALGGVGVLDVRVVDTAGQPIESMVSIDTWQQPQDQERAGLVLAGSVVINPLDGEPGHFRIENVPAGPFVTVYAQVHGALVGSVEGLRLHPGQTLERLLEVPVHLPVSFEVSGLDCQGVSVRLRALDGRRSVSTAPPGVEARGRPLSYGTQLGPDCRGDLVLPVGFYRLSVRDSSFQLVHSRDLVIQTAGEIALNIKGHELSGKLLDAAGEPLAGWTLAASSKAGLSGSSVTAQDGGFRLQGFGSEPMDLSALTPLTLLPVPVARGVELPSEGGTYRVEHASALVRLLEFETGDSVPGTVEVSGTSFDGFQVYRGGAPSELVVSESQPLRIALPAIQVTLVGRANGVLTSGAIEGALHVTLLPAAVAGIDLVLTPRKPRRFEHRGASPRASIRWFAERDGRRASGELTAPQGELVCNVPDGPVRFELIEDGQVIGATEMLVGDEPIVLEW